MRKIISGSVTAKENNMRLESFLKNRLHLTKNEISRAKFLENGICVNGKRNRVSTLLKTGDLVEILLEGSDSTSPNLTALKESLTILYEDEDVIVLDKPAGISVHPASQKDTDTLANRLIFYLRNKGEDSVIRIFGRLDRDTSGAVLAVKNRPAATRLQRQRENGSLFKSYLAITEHAPYPAAGTISAPIGNDPRKRNRMCVTADGKNAVTHYETLAAKDGCALIRLTLETGRTHQIRVHMAHTGCPLLGDPIYGSGACKSFPPDSLSPHCDDTPGENMALPPIKRTALHAESIHFLQPFTGEELLIEAPLPDDMRLYLSERGGEEVNAI